MLPVLPLTPLFDSMKIWSWLIKCIVLLTARTFSVTMFLLTNNFPFINVCSWFSLISPTDCYKLNTQIYWYGINRIIVILIKKVNNSNKDNEWNFHLPSKHWYNIIIGQLFRHQLRWWIMQKQVQQINSVSWEQILMMAWFRTS